MKTILSSGYTFTAASRRLDLSSTSGFDVRNLLAVINLTRGVIIYAVGISGLGYSSISGGNILTLAYDTTGQSDSDTLAVYYDGVGTVDTELPAAVALADGSSNPTAPAVGAHMMVWTGSDWRRVLTGAGDTDGVNASDRGLLTLSRLAMYNGSTWDRVRGDTTNGLAVNVSAASGIGSLTETAPATDTASSGLNGRLQRIAQRLTSLIALFPTALGRNADSASFSTALSTEDVALIGALTETAPATDTASSGLNGRLQRIAQRLTTLLAVFPTTIDTNSGNKSASTLRMVLATDQPSLTNALSTKEVRPATPAQSSVASSGSTTSLLASNSNRLGATIFNDSTQVLYLRLGSTASTTNYTVQIASNGYYEVPFGYTGAIDGIWASANGNARITELTA